jgi:hypothetical protein
MIDKFKIGDIIRSYQNDYTTYIVSKVNLNSIDIYVDNMTHIKYNGQSKKLFYKI